jgi:hypothetical protein
VFLPSLKPQIVVNNYGSCTTKAKKVVWDVVFPDAPGGPQDFEMDADALSGALELYKAWAKSSAARVTNDVSAYHF